MSSNQPLLHAQLPGSAMLAYFMRVGNSPRIFAI
jgi:hypothetical protein